MDSPRSLSCGVPQGSVLGYLLFTSYVAPLADLLSDYPGVEHFSFSDDLQLLVTSDNYDICIDTANSCLTVVRHWLVHNGLSFNVDKLQFLWFPPLNYVSGSSIISLRIGARSCYPSSVIRNL